MGDNSLSCEDVIRFIRKHHGVHATTPITADSLLERDLGITGDDGIELLQAIEQHFKISFSDDGKSLRPAFGLADNELLFHGEGFDIIPNCIRKFFGSRIHEVVPLSVGRLHQVICERQEASRKR